MQHYRIFRFLLFLVVAMNEQMAMEIKAWKHLFTFGTLKDVFKFNLFRIIIQRYSSEFLIFLLIRNAELSRQHLISFNNYFSKGFKFEPKTIIFQAQIYHFVNTITGFFKFKVFELKLAIIHGELALDWKTLKIKPYWDLYQR